MTHSQKIKVGVSVKSMELLRKFIDTRLIAQGAKKLSAEEQSNVGRYIFQVEPQNVSSLLTELAEIGSVYDKKENNNVMDTSVDLESKLRDREALYQKEFSDYNNSKTKYSYQLDRLNQLSKQVDSLKFAISNQRNQAMTLLYINAQQLAGQGGRVRSYQKFFLDFIKYLIVFTVVLAFLHYGTVLLVYLLAMLGIKFPSLTGFFGRGYNYYAGYKGYRGYGGYGSSYGSGKKRRVKRIYKNKSSSESDSSDEEGKE
ncbi:MAG: hypothetical protein R6V77_08465 [Candidatus Cloacimonadaceae bacterium]